MHGRKLLSTIGVAAFAVALVLVLADFAAACPTCKDNLAHDPASANLARGIYYSILFMISMPFLIFGSLCTYFYWEVCRARKRQAREPAAESDPLAPIASGG
jgi:hypothetical protein